MRSRLTWLAVFALALLPGPLRAQPAPDPSVAWDAAQLVGALYLWPLKPAGTTIEAIVAQLDPQSGYITPARFDALLSRRSTAGVGLILVPGAGAPMVGAVLEESSARQAGVRGGDVVVAIDGQPAAGRPADLANDDLRGEAGSSVSLTLRRGEATRDVVLVRAVAPRGASVASRRIGAIGYIRVDSLDEDAASGVSAAVRALRDGAPGLKGLVLDLRDCPGGLVEQAVEIADAFLGDGLLLTQRGRDPRDIERYTARRPDILSGLPIVVLVNARTAAGAEIVAGVLQDRGRARVVGMPSYGNGLIQTVIPFRGGRDGALRLTTSAWYLPSGRSIQKVGVTPDHLVARGPEDLRPQPRQADVPGALDPPPLKGAPPPARPAPAPPELPPAGYDTEAGDYPLDRALAVLEDGLPRG